MPVRHTPPSLGAPNVPEGVIPCLLTRRLVALVMLLEPRALVVGPVGVQRDRLGWMLLDAFHQGLALRATLILGDRLVDLLEDVFIAHDAPLRWRPWRTGRDEHQLVLIARHEAAVLSGYLALRLIAGRAALHEDPASVLHLFSRTAGALLDEDAPGLGGVSIAMCVYQHVPGVLQREADGRGGRGEPVLVVGGVEPGVQGPVLLGINGVAGIDIIELITPGTSRLIQRAVGHSDGHTESPSLMSARARRPRHGPEWPLPPASHGGG